MAPDGTRDETLVPYWANPRVRAASIHGEQVFFPRIAAQNGGTAPKWVLGDVFYVRNRNFFYRGIRLQGVLLAVGARLLGRPTIPLIEEEHSLFAYNAAPEVQFDAESWEAALMSVMPPHIEAPIDLTPIIRQFDILAQEQGLPGLGLGTPPPGIKKLSYQKLFDMGERRWGEIAMCGWFTRRSDEASVCFPPPYLPAYQREAVSRLID